MSNSIGRPSISPGSEESIISPLKRSLDVIVSLCLLVPAMIGILIFAALVRAVDGSAPLFVQCRVGQNGRPFNLYKLRTMKAASPEVPTHEAPGSAVTALGRLMRRTKIDELPQLLNVLRGDMSLVGPRPCLPSQVELIALRKQHGVLALRPGITGLSQLAGLDMSRPLELAQTDALYLGKWSLKRDLAIIARTFLGGGSGDFIRLQALRTEDVSQPD